MQSVVPLIAAEALAGHVGPMAAHRYRPRTIFTLTTGAIALVLGVSALRVPLMLLLAVPFAVQFAVFLSLRLELDDRGISVGASWLPPVLNVSGSWGELTWTWKSGVLQTSGSKERSLRATIDLRTFDPNWRVGPIGADISRWAPDLIARLDAADAAGGPQGRR